MTADLDREAIDICLQDPDVDGVLVILTPQAMTKPMEVAEAVVEAADKNRKPIITSWMGGKQVDPARAVFRQARIPTFNTPEAAVDAFHYLASYRNNQRLLLQTPGRLPTDHAGILADQRLKQPEAPRRHVRQGAPANAYRLGFKRRLR